MATQSKSNSTRKLKSKSLGKVVTIEKSDFADNLKATAVVGLVGVVSLGAAIFGTVKLVHFITSSASASNALDPGSAASYASQLKLAFDDGYFGTSFGYNKKAVLDTFKMIPTQSMYQQVQAQYASLYGSQLAIDLQKNADPEVYTQVLNIIASKPRK